MSLKDFQAKIGTNADGVFGKQTFDAAKKYFNINSIQAAHFFGQCFVESAGFKVFEENLNYSQNGLLTTFKKYFPSSTVAAQYAHNPKAIANRVYANRMGNGNEESGDGWNFRGRSAIMTSGKFNYSEFSKSVNDPSIMSNPDLLSTKYCFDAPKFYFDKNNLWSLCKDTSIQTITVISIKVNGGKNGLQERITKTQEIYSKFG